MFHSLYTLLKVKFIKNIEWTNSRVTELCHSSPRIQFHSACKHQGPGRKHLAHLHRLIAKHLRRRFLYLWIGFRQMARQGCALSTAVEAPHLSALCLVSCSIAAILKFFNFFFNKGPRIFICTGPQELCSHSFQ